MGFGTKTSVIKMNEERKTYIFWVGQIKYVGKIVDENSTHWLIIDRKLKCIVEIPKTAVRIEYRGEEV